MKRRVGTQRERTTEKGHNTHADLALRVVAKICLSVFRRHVSHHAPSIPDACAARCTAFRKYILLWSGPCQSILPNRRTYELTAHCCSLLLGAASVAEPIAFVRKRAHMNAVFGHAWNMTCSYTAPVRFQCLSTALFVKIRR